MFEKVGPRGGRLDGPPGTNSFAPFRSSTRPTLTRPAAAASTRRRSALVGRTASSSSLAPSTERPSRSHAAPTSTSRSRRRSAAPVPIRRRPTLSAASLRPSARPRPSTLVLASLTRLKKRASSSPAPRSDCIHSALPQFSCPEHFPLPSVAYSCSPALYMTALHGDPEPAPSGRARSFS